MIYTKQNFWLNRLYKNYRKDLYYFKRFRYLNLSLKFWEGKIIKIEPFKMRKELLEQYEKKLIEEICLSVDGIGTAKAGAVASYFDDFQDFLNAQEKELLLISSKSGKPILASQTIKDLIIEKDKVVKGRAITETWVGFLAKLFIKSQVKTLEEMSFDNLDLNPLLARALALETPDDVIRFNLYQSMTRSCVTSWGTLVQKMLMFSGGEIEMIKFGIKGREPDVIKKIDGKTHCFQIKSGPNTMNVDMIESLNEVIEKVEKQGYVGWLGMTYGRKSRVSPQILGNLKDAGTKTKIGRELWDFIAESKDYHKRIIQIIDESTQKELKVSYNDLMEAKIKEFCQIWKAKYDNLPLNTVLEDYL